MSENTQQANIPRSAPRDTERFVDISGTGPAGRPKAHVLFRQYEQYSDGTEREIQTLSFVKPIINVFKHAGYVNVYLDFGSIDDVDLRIVWNMLSNFSRAEQSVSYLPEELESGKYLASDGRERMVYFPVIDLVLSPAGRESEYQLHGYNPAFFTLGPKDLRGEACVLQLTFPEEWFVVINDLEPVDYSLINHEILQELGEEDARR